jgi:hypothetical protein
MILVFARFYTQFCLPTVFDICHSEGGTSLGSSEYIISNGLRRNIGVSKQCSRFGRRALPMKHFFLEAKSQNLVTLLQTDHAFANRRPLP